MQDQVRCEAKERVALRRDAPGRVPRGVLARPALYRAAVDSADEALRLLPHFVVANPLNTWTDKGREMPEAPTQTFHGWWRENRGQAGKML